MDGISKFAVSCDECVADFVVRDTALQFFGEAAALALGASDDFLDGFFQILLLDFLHTAARGEQGGFVDGVGEIGAGKPGRGLRDLSQLDVVAHGLPADMDAQDCFPAFKVGRIDDDLPIEASRPQQGAIEHIRAIGGGQENNAGVGFEAVHFD